MAKRPPAKVGDLQGRGGGQKGVKIKREKQKSRYEETTALRVGVSTMRIPNLTQRENLSLTRTGCWEAAPHSLLPLL